VIGIIARSAWKLMNATLKRDALLWVIFVALGISTAATEREIVWLFITGGLVYVALKAFPQRLGTVAAPAVLVGAGMNASLGTFGQVLAFFAKAGLFVFRSGLAVVPFLHGGVVLEHQWLNERQLRRGWAPGTLSALAPLISKAQNSASAFMWHRQIDGGPLIRNVRITDSDFILPRVLQTRP
jgi:chromate transport protein ChrA